MTELIKTSVRDLVGFALRRGDLGAAGFASTSRLVAGTRGHQQVQRARPPGYQMEVPISHTVETEGLALEISGRIDGLLVDEDRVLVEEIKTTHRDLDPATPDNPAHWGQARVYAYMLALQDDLDQVDIQLTYLHLDSGATWEDRRTFGLDELAAFFADIVARYLHWARIYHNWRHERDQSIATLEFPFPAYRPGQRQLAVAAYRSIEARRRLFAQAPTGIGKTISTLFPSIKALQQGHAEKIFYLTAKTSGRLVAEKTFEALRRKGLRCKSLTLTARDKICFNPQGEPSCDPEQCEYAIGYYDRINDALEELFAQDAFTRPAIEAVARKHKVCPFEFSLDLSLWADAIICDYNYVFDPRAYLKRFFLDNAGDYAFLIDEAHNLVDRAREMFSAELYKLDVLALKRMVKEDHPTLGRRLDKLNATLLHYRRLCGDEGDGQTWASAELPHDLLPQLRDFVAAAEPILGRNMPSSYRRELSEFYFQAVAFLRIAELFDDHYITYVEKIGRDARLRLFCLDPSRQIRAALKRGTSALFFSATLTPLEYFRVILGGDEEDALLNLESPFPPEHLHLSLGDHIQTTYKKRDESYDDVAAAIAALISQKRGNYLAFFPSYRYMEEVAGRFAAANSDVEILVQQSGMSESQREDFLAVFDADNPETVLGFAVMGGIFGEGIDLEGERLVGAAIVGVGLPQICLERNLIRAYYDAREISGFDYAYTYPGMNRVLQAVGRVIRSAADRGVVLLLDERFGQARYRRLFPPYWRPPQAARSPAHISKAVEGFWQRRG